MFNCNPSTGCGNGREQKQRSWRFSERPCLRSTEESGGTPNVFWTPGTVPAHTRTHTTLKTVIHGKQQLTYKRVKIL